MKVASRHIYSAPPEAVLAAMTTPAVLMEKYESLGHRDVAILEHAEHDQHDQHQHGGVRIRTRRGVPMDVPGFARRFLSPVNTVEQSDEWGPAACNGARTGTWRVSASGVPVSAGGALTLAPAPGEGTVVEITGDVTCSIPLVGGKIASFVGGDVERTMHAEERFNDEYLARRVAQATGGAGTKPRVRHS